MPQVLFRPVTRRNPFRVVELPACVKFSIYAERQRSRTKRRWLGKAAKLLFRTVHHRLGLPATGRMHLAGAGGSAVELVFDASNTHYGYLYRPGTAAGYEPMTSALLDSLVPDKGVFYDIGSNWGYFAIFIASRQGFEGKVHAFEPLSAVHGDLESLVAQAGFEDRVVCHHKALSDRAGLGTISTHRGFHSALARLDDGGSGEKVALARLDDLDIPPPDVMKIDVEGHEARVLDGARGILRQHQPMIVFESWERPDDPGLTLGPFRVLAGLGYEFFRPMWQVTDGDSAYLIDDVAALKGAETGTLALLPFLAEHRFAFGRDINVFACHRQRLEGIGQGVRPALS